MIISLGHSNHCRFSTMKTKIKGNDEKWRFIGIYHSLEMCGLNKIFLIELRKDGKDPRG